MHNNEYDVVVVGGGMVGATLACGLANNRFRVAVIEQGSPPRIPVSEQSEIKVSAISHSSVVFLRKVGVWPLIDNTRCNPYRRIKVWEHESTSVNFDAKALELSELGFMLENNALRFALWKFMNQKNIKHYCFSNLNHLVRNDEDGWDLQLSNESTIKTSLVIGADGTNSQVRKLVGIGTYGWGYTQSCMLVNIAYHNIAGDLTWQHFTPSGPRAFLPLFNNQASLVWYDTPDRLRYLSSMPIFQLKREILANFPRCLGDFEVQATEYFPLSSHHVKRYVLPGLALVGDAAHKVNPLAGQGVNLGFRDIESLLEIMVRARDNGERWSSEQVLLRYQSARKSDNLIVKSFIDLLYLLFSRRSLPLELIRNACFLSVRKSELINRLIMRQALGF